jgi:hypothetical protein
MISEFTWKVVAACGVVTLLGAIAAAWGMAAARL